MPKSPSLSSDKVIKILKKNGFVHDRTRGSHQIYFNPKTRKRAVVPKNKNLPIGTLKSILKQAGLEMEDFQ